MGNEITGESIKSAIAVKLGEDFGSDLPAPKLYKEKIVQGLVKPCFFIWTMDISQEKLMRNNYERTYQMNIRFHPPDDDPTPYQTLQEIGNRLTESLSVIYPTDFPVFGKQMSFQIIENVLQFYVSYTLKLHTITPTLPVMEDLEIHNY